MLWSTLFENCRQPLFSEKAHAIWKHPALADLTIFGDTLYSDERRPCGDIMRAHLMAHNDLSELPRLSEFLAKFGSVTGLPEDLVGDFELALEEVFVNAVT